MPSADPSLLASMRPSLTWTEPASAGRWLSIVGIGEDGIDGLSETARNLVREAAIVFGGKRHLALAASLIGGDARPWASPFDVVMAEVLALRGQPVCVLASGDPFMHGVGSVLARHVRPAEMVAVPAPSAFSLAAARLAWALPDTVQLSLHGRALDLIRPHLHPGARILALTSDSKSAAALAQLLNASGFGASQVGVLERLGGPHERIRWSQAEQFDVPDIDPLNTVAIEVVAGPGARIVPFGSGLPDDLFEHDGQITKREVRALTVSSLAPRHGACLWDIGAGSGSVAIEWLLAHPSLRAIAIERRPDRAARIARNAALFGVPHLSVIEGAAPDALDKLPRPDAVFIGGGATAPGLFELVCAALQPGGRLVVNAVTLETEAALLSRQTRLGGSLTRIALSRAEPVGAAADGPLGWRPAHPVTQWVWVKP